MATIYSAMDIFKMQLSTIALAIEKALPYTLDLNETASDVLIYTLAIGARVAVDLECPPECKLSVKDNVHALRLILEPFTNLESYTNDTAGILCENVEMYIKKIYAELS